MQWISVVVIELSPLTIAYMAPCRETRDPFWNLTAVRQSHILCGKKLVLLTDGRSGCRPSAVPARWPEPNAGVARNVRGQHIWLLIFFVLFACGRSRQKGHKEYELESDRTGKHCL